MSESGQWVWEPEHGAQTETPPVPPAPGAPPVPEPAEPPPAPEPEPQPAQPAPPRPPGPGEYDPTGGRGNPPAIAEVTALEPDEPPDNRPGPWSYRDQ